MNVKESLLEVETTLQELKKKNQYIPIIVEGRKDKRTLQNLGLKGKIIVYNKGKSLPNFCDWVAMHHRQVVILTDWDRRGGMLCRRMMNLFNGRVLYDITFRENLSKHTMIKTVEGLDSWLETMKNMGVESSN
jgi:5S rRNA maturation endonuclease (ribonuclease M5)